MSNERSTGSQIEIIGRLLSDLDENIPSESPTKQNLQSRWQALTDACAPLLSALAEDVFAKAGECILAEALNRSQMDHLVFPNAHIRLAEARLRPGSEYYALLGKTPPAPENPDGSHSAGLSVSLAVFVPFSDSRIRHPARLYLEWEVWGEEERQAFLDLFRDYRRLVEKLLSYSSYDFFCSVPFENMERYGGKNHIRLLELYAENPQDDENQCALSKEYVANDPVARVVEDLVPLLILYDCTLGYLSNPRQRDRIMHYLPWVDRGTVHELHS